MARLSSLLEPNANLVLAEFIDEEFIGSHFCFAVGGSDDPNSHDAYTLTYSYRHRQFSVFAQLWAISTSD
jgi:hypothetical protein